MLSVDYGDYKNFKIKYLCAIIIKINYWIKVLGLTDTFIDIVFVGYGYLLR